MEAESLLYLKVLILVVRFFFKPGTHLHLEEKAVLKGSDDISNFPVIETRMEGQNLKVLFSFD